MSSVGPLSTAHELLSALDQGLVSARDLLALQRARIERYNDQLNVIVETDWERAEHAASAADERRSRGERASLLGLPVTLKESINVVGLRTTVGMPMWRDFRAQQHGAIAERVLGAGAVLLGKTNVPPMLEQWEADNPIYGRTNNPWDLSRSPGGSTAGAAAVAAGLTPLEFGSDLGGSIRVPANFCGVYGHKPSATALPRSGQGPFPPMPNPGALLGVQGPLARAAGDLELALEAVAGSEIGEDVAWRIELPPARHARLSRYRVAFLSSVDWLPVSSEISAAEQRLISTLDRLGCKVAEARPDALVDARAHFDLYLRLLFVLTSVRLPPEPRAKRVSALCQSGHPFALAEAAGLSASASEYLLWLLERERVRASFREFFRDWDVLICPVFPTTAFLHTGHGWPPDPASPFTLDVDGAPLPGKLGLFYPSVATLAGQPATAFPLGLGPSGLPVGLQAIGPYLEDRTPLRFCALLAQAIGGFVAPPQFA